ncbi:MAG: IS630 family transposase [Rhodobacteraceae bacterium]|nr:IS630 family transposase [Paracoccaceae bacterium]
MRDNDGRKIDHATLEVLRMRAVDRIAAGAPPAEVAQTLGLHRGSVYRWWAEYRQGGKEALVAKPVPGRPATLTDDQLARLADIVAHKDPLQLSFDFGLWTVEMIATVVHREFGVQLHRTTVGRILRKLGFTPQRPLRRAFQQDPENVEKWKTETFPKICKQARKAGATIYFADEAGVRSDYHSGTTWAPTGKTPVVRTTGARHRLNMLSAITTTGQLRFMVRQGSVGAAVFVEFCKRLLADTDGPVYLIVDGHPAHRAKTTTEFVASTGGRLQLHLLPGYSPELNPDEWVWKNIKHDQIGKKTITSGEQFNAIVTSALHRLQKQTSKIRGFFADPNLAYITA